MEHTLTEPRTGAKERVKSKNRIRHGFGFALAMLGAIILSLSLLLASLHIVAFQPGHYRAQYERLNVPAATRIAMPELMQVTGVMLDYLRGDASTMQTTATIDGVYREVFTERELMHMDDVRNLMLLARRVMLPAFIAGALCVLLSLLMCYGHARKTFKGLAWGAGVLVGALGTIVLLAILNFNALFTRFHLIFFTNDLWLLDPASSVLINMVPLDFFVATATRIAIFWAVMFVLATDAGIWLALCFTEKKKIAKKAGVNAPKASIETFIEAGIEKQQMVDAEADTTTAAIEAQAKAPLLATEASSGDDAQEAEEPQTSDKASASDAPETPQPEAEWAVVTVSEGEGERFVIDRPTGTRPDAQSIFERFGLPDEDDAEQPEEPAQPEPPEEDEETVATSEPGDNGDHGDDGNDDDDTDGDKDDKEVEAAAEVTADEEVVDLEETIDVVEEAITFEEILICEEDEGLGETVVSEETMFVEDAVEDEAAIEAEETVVEEEAAATEPAMAEEQRPQAIEALKEAEGGLRWFSSVILPDHSVPVAEVEDEIPDPDDLIAYWNQVREARRLGLPLPEMPKPRPKPEPAPIIEEAPEDACEVICEASCDAADALEVEVLEEVLEVEAAEEVTQEAMPDETALEEAADESVEETAEEMSEAVAPEEVTKETAEERADAQPIDMPIEDIDDAAILLDRLAPLVDDSDEAARLLAQLRKLL